MATIMVCKEDGEVVACLEYGIAQVYDPIPEQDDDFFTSLLNAIEEADA